MPEALLHPSLKWFVKNHLQISGQSDLYFVEAKKRSSKRPLYLLQVQRRAVKLRGNLTELIYHLGKNLSKTKVYSIKALSGLSANCNANSFI